MKIKIIALAVALFSANNALATENISLDMYRQLLPKDSSGQIDYDLHLADKLSLPYHCNIKQDSEGVMKLIWITANIMILTGKKIVPAW